MDKKWRTGRTIGRTIYRQVGDQASKKDQFVGVMDTVELADLVVAALNAYEAEQERTATSPFLLPFDDPDIGST
jgi:hypothetical protein